MPSSNHSVSSSPPCLLAPQTPLDYCPDTCDDPEFHGIAVGCPEVCREHRLEPRKCVAFEGSNVGRRFYMCQVQDEFQNCGFQSWLDNEWPQTLKNAIGRLWSMYDLTSSARIDDRIENAKLLKDMNEEKNKTEKKYLSLMNDVRQFMDDTQRRVMEANYQKIKGKEQQEMEQKDCMIARLTNEVQVLKNAMGELKQLVKTQAEVMKEKQNAAAVERETLKEQKNAAVMERDALKEEKKKLEYVIYEMIQAGDANKEKMQRIRNIMDE